MLIGKVYEHGFVVQRTLFSISDYTSAPTPISILRPHPDVLQLHLINFCTFPYVKHPKRRGFCFFFTEKKKKQNYEMARRPQKRKYRREKRHERRTETGVRRDRGRYRPDNWIFIWRRSGGVINADAAKCTGDAGSLSVYAGGRSVTRFCRCGFRKYRGCLEKYFCGQWLGLSRDQINGIQWCCRNGR